MSEEHKRRCIKAMVAYKGDDLERAEAAFRGCSDQELDSEYGHSGRTRREILEGYREERKKNEAAIAWLEGVKA